MKIWNFIESHHRGLGAALFVVPPLLGAMIIAGVGYVVSFFLG